MNGRDNHFDDRVGSRRSVESHAHRHAKQLLADWLREAAAAVGHDEYARFPIDLPLHCHECLHDSSICRSPRCLPHAICWRVNRPGPSWGIWCEYPVLADGTGIIPVWDEVGPQWRSRPPSYDDLTLAGRMPACVIDIAVQHKGMIVYALEIVHKHHCTATKIEFLREKLAILEIPAAWILGQVDRPRGVPAEFWL
ncbi:MAG TPA: hypothetical protein VJN43_03665 [Bryobacteraceae bacterium]|nr:hypothetical protein [Bryobacteraceae bacterium]